MDRKRNVILLVKGTPGVRLVFRAILRFKIFSEKLTKYAGEGIRWLLFSRETTNLTGDLTANSERFLTSSVGLVTQTSIDQVTEFFNELKNDTNLLEYYIRQVSAHRDKFITDSRPRFGRRLAWYAMIRILKPKVVIETGVDKGLGSLVITAALKKNAEEGFEGKYYGTDINPTAGYLLNGDYASYGEVLIGDSITSLKQFTKTVDLFISDSDHDPNYERKEYATINPKLSDNAIVLSDQGTNELLEYSISEDRKFMFFHDQTTSSWISSSGIGFSWKSKGS